MMVRADRAACGWAALCLLALAGCRVEQADNNQAAPANAAANNAAAPASPPVIAAPEPPLDREALLLAVVRARSAAATGVDDRTAQAELNGKSFSFRLRLGCSLAGGEAGGRFAASYDPEARRVELSAAPNLSIEDPAVAALAGERFEAAEGFWVADPWLLAPHCGGAAQASPPVGLAQFFTETDPRTGRRDGRPYEARQTLAEGSRPEAGSWDLVLNGRLRRLGDDRVILCRAPVPGAAPVCVVSVAFDQVEIRNVRTDQQLAEWRAG